ncbi:hypothetical protein [Sphingomonas sp.]
MLKIGFDTADRHLAACAEIAPKLDAGDPGRRLANILFGES